MRTTAIAALSGVAILTHLILRFGVGVSASIADLPLWAALALGGAPLVYDLVRKALRREFGSDLLAGLSIVTAILLGQ